MFNIKNIVNKITDRGRESQPNSPGGGDESSNNQGAEGFLCPKCMTAFQSPEELKSHYEELHNSVDATETAVAGFGILHQEAGFHLQRQAQGGQNISQDKLAAEIEGITNIGELQKSLMDALESKAQLQLEKECMEQRTAQLARVNAAMKSVNDEEQGKTVALKDRLKILEDQLAHRESIDDAAVLRQELVQVQRVMDEGTRDLERQRDELQAELLDLKARYEHLLQNPGDLEVIPELHKIIKKEEESSVKMKKQMRKLEALNIQEREKNAELACELALLKRNMEELTADSNVTSQKLLEAQQQVQALNIEAAVTKNNLDEKHSEAESLSRELHNSKNQLESLVSKMEVLTLAQTHTASLMQDKDERLAKVTNELKRHATEGAGAAKAAVQQLAEENEARFRELQNANLKLKVDCKAAEDAQENVKKELESKSSLVFELEKDLEASSARMTSYQTELSAGKKQLKSAEKSLNAEVEKVSGLKDRLAEIQISYQLLVDELAEKSKLLQTTQDDLNDLKDEHRGLQAEKLELDVTRASLETVIFSMEKKDADNQDYMQDLRDELMNLGTNYDIRGTHINMTELELEKVQGQLAAEIADKEVVVGERDAALHRLVIADALIDEMTKFNETKMKNIDSLKAQLATFESSAAAELESIKKSMVDTTERNNKALEDLKTSYNSKTEELHSMQLALDEVSGEKLVLEAHLLTSQTEQKTLMEKYYTSNSENEAQRRSLDEFRRRCEDSQSGLHELGRENQILRMELEKLLGRKWTEDSDVASCHLCQKEFSLLVRRHHCRNCGQIFCNECSAKCAAVANNKKPVRVCDGCYNELASM